MNKHWLAFLFVCSLLLPQQLVAEPLYQQQVNQAAPSEKQIDEALKKIKDHKEIKLQENISIPVFHQRADQLKTAKQAICTNCHQALPHRKNERSRTFMNRHSRYIACETCHLRSKNIDLEYAWLAYDGADAGNKVAARVLKQDENKKDKPEPPLTLVPQVGAKIAPFYAGELALIFADDDFSKKINQDWQDANENEKAKLKARVHVPLEEKGPQCQRCHGGDNAMLDLASLGASPEQVKKIQRNTIARFFARFKKDDQRIRIKDLLK